MTRSSRRPPMVGFALLALLTVTTATTGCLFPPVDHGDGADGTGTRPPPFEPEDPDDYVTRSGHQNAHDTLGPGMQVGGNTVGSESVDVDLVLPPRVTALTVTLDWFDDDATETNGTHRLTDLDLLVKVDIITDERTETIWTREDNGGGPGSPDAPATVSSTEDDVLTYENAATLKATITPESSTGGVRWVLEVDYFYLVPRDAA